MPSPDPEIARLQCAVREQMQTIDQLQAELSTLVDWIMHDVDALTTLQRTYLDPKSSTTDRIKAAASAIGYERPKVATTTNLFVVDFRERVRQARLKASEPKVIEHQP
jgi:hypothetical protein